MEQKRGRNLFFHFILIFYVIICLGPLVWLAMSSFKTPLEITLSPWGFPDSFHFENYINAWQEASISTFFFNSLFIALATCVISLLVGAAAAFALARMKFQKASLGMYQFFLLGLVVPGGALLIPLYSVITSLGLYNTRVALVLLYVTFSLPVTIFILVAFMRSIPRELEEAGVMDGIGPFGLFVKIILPMTAPALSTVFILNFINSWNEFVMALLFTADKAMRTLPVGMNALKTAYQTDYALLSAGVMYSIVPVIIIFLILQKQVIAGITAGSVKG
ncbi:MAG TPA: carbohydrate ABC transporter permease [Bacillales bacterium]